MINFFNIKTKILSNLFFLIIIFLALRNCQPPENSIIENIIFAKKTKNKIEVTRENSNSPHLTYRKNAIKIDLYKEDGSNSNVYSAPKYNYIEFNIPKDTQSKFTFSGDCVIPVLLATDPDVFLNFFNFSDDLVTIFFNDIGLSDLKNLNINSSKIYQSDDDQEKFSNQEIINFNKEHKGIIYCFEFKKGDTKNLSFEVSWFKNTSTSPDPTPLEDPENEEKDDESKIDENIIKTDVPKDKPKETISGNQVNLDFDNGSSEVFYENVFEINSGEKVFNLENLKKFSSIDFQDLKDNDLEIEISYEENNKTITQNEKKKKLVVSLENIDLVLVNVKLVNPSLTSFLSFRATTKEEVSQFLTSTFIIIAILCSLILIFMIGIIIFCFVKKQNERQKKKYNTIQNNENVQNIKKNPDDDDNFIPVFQIDYVNKITISDYDNNTKYPKMEESFNTIDKNITLNYPDQVNESVIKKEPAKKKEIVKKKEIFKKKEIVKKTQILDMNYC